MTYHKLDKWIVALCVWLRYAGRGWWRTWCHGHNVRSITAGSRCVWHARVLGDPSCNSSICHRGHIWTVVSENKMNKLDRFFFRLDFFYFWSTCEYNSLRHGTEWISDVMACCKIWSWSPMPCEKHGLRDSLDKIQGRRPRFLSLLRPEGHDFSHGMGDHDQILL